MSEPPAPSQGLGPEGRQPPAPNNDHTHYWCKIYRALELSTKHHMISLEPLIQPGQESYMHHMVLSCALTLTISHWWRQTQ